MVVSGIRQGFSNVPWHKRAFWPGAKYVLGVRPFVLGHSWGLVSGEGGGGLVRYLCTT